MKLSISLPAEEVGFLDAYARSKGIKSRSGVIQTALRLLRTSELSDDYASAWQNRMKRTTRRGTDHPVMVSVAVERLRNRVGRVPQRRMNEVDAALRLHLNL